MCLAIIAIVLFVGAHEFLTSSDSLAGKHAATEVQGDPVLTLTPCADAVSKHNCRMVNQAGALGTSVGMNLG